MEKCVKMKTFSQLKRGNMKIETVKNYLKKAEKASKAYNKEDFKSFTFFVKTVKFLLILKKFIFIPLTMYITFVLFQQHKNKKRIYKQKRLNQFIKKF